MGVWEQALLSTGHGLRSQRLEKRGMEELSEAAEKGKENKHETRGKVSHTHTHTHKHIMSTGSSEQVSWQFQVNQSSPEANTRCLQQKVPRGFPKLVVCIQFVFSDMP